MRRLRRSGPLVLASVALLGLDWPGQGAARAAEFARAEPARRVELLYALAPSAEPAARAALAAALADDDAAVRETARRLAARFPAEALVPALVRALEDPDAAARAEALDALAAARSPDARRAIERALSDRSPAVRARAVLALGGAGADALVALLDRVHDPEGDVRAAAANALGRIGDPRAALALVGISQDPIPEVRLAAARALGELPGEVAARALLGLAHDAIPEVRLAALVGMQRHPDPATVPTLAALARPDPAAALAGRDDRSRAAVATLGAIDSAEARQALLALALDPRAPRAREAIEALGAHPERLRGEVSAVLARVTRDNVEALADLLGRIGGDAAADALVDLLARGAPRGGSPVVLRALGRSGADRALRALLEQLTARDAADAVRRDPSCARGALDPALLDALSLWSEARRGLDPLAVDPLVEALQRLDPACHEQLAAMLRLLGLTGNDRAAPTLVALLRHPTAAVRAAAAEALGRAVAPAATAPLVGALSDVDPTVRAAAATALRAHPPAALVPLLAARWRDPSPVDRGALLLALGHALAADGVSASSRADLLPLLADAAARGPTRTRAAALRALGDLAGVGDAGALRALAAAASDRRLAPVAIEALGNLPSSASADLLTTQLAGVRPAEVRAAAAWAMRAGGAASVGALCAVVGDGPSPAAHNALAALSRVDLDALQGPGRASLVATARGIAEARRAGAANACALLSRLGAPCADAVASQRVEPTTTDLRVLDVARDPVTRPVLLRLGDGVTVWVTPDDDGWLRVRDTAAGPIAVLDRADDDQ